MSRRRVSNPLALAVLSCLNERPMHPYEISTTLRNRGKEQSIKLNYGSLYAVVESLQKHGLIRRARRPARAAGPSARSTRSPQAGVDGVRGLARRTAVDAGARVHLARGRAVADARPAARRGRAGCSTTAPSGCASSCARSTPADAVARRDGRCPSCSSSRAATGRRMLDAELDVRHRPRPAASGPATLGGTGAVAPHARAARRAA